MRLCRLWSALLLSVLAGTVPLPAADEAAGRELFENKIRPVLVQQCQSCHSGEWPQGGLRLDHRAGWEAGGKSGPVVVRGDSGKSLLIRAIRQEDSVTPMPLGGKKLPPDTISAFEEWVRSGAFDPREKPTTAAPVTVSKTWEETYNERRKWWSLQPVSRPPIPPVKQTLWPRQPLDRFVLARMEAAGLAPSPRADRITLLRRLSFVLTGLPPTPEELDAFLADRDPRAYEKLVNRLLGSVHFGEHWARHWMDVVRYSDTYGYESEIPAKNAWRYRDYLIRAFNGDVPYDQLLREQIAGDLLPSPRINPASQINESVIGTMFYLIGEMREGDSLQFNGIHQEMVNSQIDAFSKAFQALTVGCARCHDHKLEAVSQRDYYAMAGMFMSSRWVANTLDTPERNRVTLQRLGALKPKIHEAVAEWWLESVADLPKRLETAEPEQEKKTPAQKKADDKTAADAEKDKKAPMENPLYIWFELKAAQAKGESISKAWQKLADSYASARKQRMESSARDYVTIANFSEGAPAGWSIDGVGLRQGPVSSGDFAVSLEGSSAIQMLMPAGLFTNSLSPRLNGVLRTPLLSYTNGKRLSIQAAGGDLSTVSQIVGNAFMTERQVYLKTIQPQWAKLSLADGGSPDMPRTEEEKAEMKVYAEVATKASNPNFPPRIGLIQKVATFAQERDPRSWFGVTRVVEHSNDKPPADELARFESLLAGEPPVDLAAAAVRFQGWAKTAIDAWSRGAATEDHVWIINWLIEKNLLPNKMEEREPVRLLVNYYRSVEKQIADPQTVNGMVDVDPGRDYRLNVRGVYEDLGERVPRGYVEVLAGERSEAPKNSGRLELANRVASAANPLTARVFVNRVWHWIFGTGIVATTDDFGHLGERPSHPELLDYLASEFVANGWSVKKLVRSILLSETFKQSGSTSAKAPEADPLNRLLSHYPLRRLEAESIRDSLLAVSSRLDRQLYGETIDPSRTKEQSNLRLFSGPLDGNGRRSLYIKMTIMDVPKFLAVFGQPSPKVPTGRRDKTHSPAQALAMMNDPFVVAQAEFWAKSLVEQPHRDPQQRIAVMFRRAFGRDPDLTELARWTRVASDLSTLHDVGSNRTAQAADLMKSLDVWKDMAHTMFNAKEFIYVR